MSRHQRSVPQLLRVSCWLLCALVALTGSLGCDAVAQEESPEPGAESATTPANQTEGVPNKPNVAKPGKAKLSLATDQATNADQSSKVNNLDQGIGEGEDWPQFLGLRENGISGETGLLKSWPDKGPPILWQKRIGTGYSAPSVRGNRLVLHHRVRDEEIIQCYSADQGEPAWDYAYESQFSDPYGYNNGPRCSPLLTETRCYTFGAGGKLVCLELATGKMIWTRDTAEDWKIPDAFFGVGSTPIIHGNLLIVMVGGEPKSGVVAFDKETGKTVWESIGKNAWKVPEEGYQMDDKLASYSSLIVARIHDHDHLLCLMRDGLVSLNPVDGTMRFSYFFRSRSFESVNAARPVVIGDQVLLSAAYQSGAVLLKLLPDGKSFEEVWKTRNLQTHWSTTIHHAGYLYGFSGRHENEGLLRCLDLKSGEVIWETDGLPAEPPTGPDNLDETATKFYGRGSAILADGKFIVLGERGVLALVEANHKEYKEISRVKYTGMKYPSWAAPVLSRKRLYLRCEDYLACIDLAPPAK